MRSEKSSLTLLPRQQCLGSMDLIFPAHLNLSITWQSTCSVRIYTREKQMAMTTPVFTRKIKTDGEKMDMATPVITRKTEDGDKWTMSFVMPSKYGGDLPLPKDSSVTIKEVPKRVIAVAAFSGFVTDEEVERRESILRRVLSDDLEFSVREGCLGGSCTYNPPFTFPFNRVERKET